MPLYKKPKTIEELEEVVKQNEDQFEKEQETEPKEEQLSEEEKVFKKRFSDSRRFIQKLQEERKIEQEKYLAEISELKKNAVLNIPSDEDEYNEWLKKYPEASKRIEQLVTKKLSKMDEVYQQKFNDVEELKNQERAANARRAFLELQPNFLKIRDSVEFGEWINSPQGKKAKKVLFETEPHLTDPQEASDYIDLFVMKTGFKLDKKVSEVVEDNDKAVAESPSKKSKTTPRDAKGFKFKESEIAKMGVQEYSKHQDEIMEAHRNGEILMDITG